MPSTFLLAAALAAAAAQPSTSSAEPAGKWTVDFADDRCVAQRDFTAGGRRFTFAFQLPITNHESASFYLLAPPADAERWKGVQVTVPGVPAPTFTLGEGLVQQGKTYLAIRYLAEGAATALPKAARVDLKARDMAVSVPLDALARLKPILDTCERDLLVTRGIPAEAVKAIAVWPQVAQNPASYVIANDYPVAAIRAKEQGTVSVMLTILPSGRPSECKVVGSSGSATLDTTTCDILTRRSRYKPARDKAGTPIQGYATARIRWQLPRG